nr:S8 family serine peptidase [uncultured Duganella sp.]
MKLRPVSAAIALLLSGLALHAHADDVRRPYIVQLADQPVAAYTGGVAGITGTKPVAGGRLDTASPASQAYVNYLDQKQQSAKALVPSAPVLYHYNLVLNGFAAMLTDAEVRALQANAGVTSITADAPREPLTSYTPSMLGLDGAEGLWSQLGGKDKAGEGIVVGVIDSGIWPESPSYADRVDADGKPTFANDGALAYTPLPGWQGTCQSGEGFTVASCNNKLIGARFFNTGFKASGLVQHWSDFTSPRDSIGGGLGEGGHGTHTSTTAAGNNGVDAFLPGGIPMGATSGMAPRARIAAYKVCWSYNDATRATGARNSCWGADSVAAIEAAVSDGVDVLNYSISGGTTVTDTVDLAFLNATNAGVFVSASAGNDGPANEVNHISPWLATIGASTHGRESKASAALGSGTTYSGASLNLTPVQPKPLINGSAAARAGASADAARLCYSANWAGGPGLDPAKVAGKIVTCVRGTNDRVDKSRAVKEAGGVGMIMVDNGGGTVAEIHSVPTVHVSAADGALIQAYAATPGATAGISKFANSISPNAPVMAGFSSRGPNRFNPDVLKPDMTAPGVDVLAGVSQGLTQAQRADLVNGTLAGAPAFALYQGTSMSSPHVAGVAALLRQQHPTWSPAAIKSALMTSATSTFDDGLAGQQNGLLPWSQGAGHINPTGVVPRPSGKSYNSAGAADPGLVYDLGATDYKRYLCGEGVSGQCGDGALSGANLNLPSITLGNVVAPTDVTRTVTNVGASAATYTASATLPGFSAAVTPASLTLAPGESGSFNVRVTRTTAANNVWQFGELTWQDGSHIVRVPLTARSGRAVTAPALASSTRGASSLLVSLIPGFTGRIGTAVGGFKEVARGNEQTLPGILEPLDSAADGAAACKAGAVGTRLVPVTVPANTVAVVLETFDRDTGASGGPVPDDLDLLLLDPQGGVAASSLNGGSNERVRLNSPSAGAYQACVINYAPADGVATAFRLSSAVVTRADLGGNLRVATPSRVYTNIVATATASWSGLAAGKRYYGGLQFLDTAGNVGASTTILVQTNDPVPMVQGLPRATRRLSSR